MTRGSESKLSRNSDRDTRSRSGGHSGSEDEGDLNTMVRSLLKLARSSDVRLGQVETELHGVSNRIGNVETICSNTFAEIDTRLKASDDRFSAIERQFQEMHSKTVDAGSSTTGSTAALASQLSGDQLYQVGKMALRGFLYDSRKSLIDEKLAQLRYLLPRHAHMFSETWTLGKRGTKGYLRLKAGCSMDDVWSVANAFKALGDQRPHFNVNGTARFLYLNPVKVEAEERRDGQQHRLRFIMHQQLGKGVELECNYRRRTILVDNTKAVSWVGGAWSFVQSFVDSWNVAHPQAKTDAGVMLKEAWEPAEA